MKLFALIWASLSGIIWLTPLKGGALSPETASTMGSCDAMFLACTCWCEIPLLERACRTQGVRHRAMTQCDGRRKTEPRLLPLVALLLLLAHGARPTAAAKVKRRAVRTPPRDSDDEAGGEAGGGGACRTVVLGFARHRPAGAPRATLLAALRLGGCGQRRTRLVVRSREPSSGMPKPMALNSLSRCM
jgi:hypothetical protein